MSSFSTFEDLRAYCKRAKPDDPVRVAFQHESARLQPMMIALNQEEWVLRRVNAQISSQ